MLAIGYTILSLATASLHKKRMILLRRHLGFGLNIAALGLFFPGILLPMFALNMEMAAVISGSTLSSTLVDKELSIIATVQELWMDERIVVAALIFIFSVCIPLLKSSALTLAYFKRNKPIEGRLVGFVSSIGKWSMADVFVVAIFLAILSTNHGETGSTQQLSVFGFKMAIDISSQTLSSIGHGFYFFTAYCLLSLLGTHFSQSALKHNPAK
jgi:paraquat-inducible protein A